MDIFECVLKCKNGDADSKLKLIEKFRPLIDSYNRKFLGEDIESILIISILNTTEKIDLSKFDRNNQGGLFNYYAFTIKNAYVDYVRKESTKQKNVKIVYDEELVNFVSDDMHIEVDSFLSFESLIRNLTDIQKYVIREIFLNGKSEVEIAKEENITKQAVSGIKRRAFDKIKKSDEFMEVGFI